MTKCIKCPYIYEEYIIFILFITSLIIFTDLVLLIVPYVMLENKIYLTQWLTQ